MQPNTGRKEDSAHVVRIITKDGINAVERDTEPLYAAASRARRTPATPCIHEVQLLPARGALVCGIPSAAATKGHDPARRRDVQASGIAYVPPPLRSPAVWDGRGACIKACVSPPAQ